VTAAQLFDDAHRRAWIAAASKAYACEPREAIAKAAELVAMLEEPRFAAVISTFPSRGGA